VYVYVYVYCQIPPDVIQIGHQRCLHAVAVPDYLINDHTHVTIRSLFTVDRVADKYSEILQSEETLLAEILEDDEFKTHPLKDSFNDDELIVLNLTDDDDPSSPRTDSYGNPTVIESVSYSPLETHLTDHKTHLCLHNCTFYAVCGVPYCLEPTWHHSGNERK